MKRSKFKRNTVLYRTWYSMIQRCYNPGAANYRNYGGRGIRVSKAWWNSFERFARDMGPKPSPQHSINRIDNDGDYCKKNCEWATNKTQQRNKRNTLYVKIMGKKHKTIELSETYDISHATAKARLQRGVSPEEAFIPPANSRIMDKFGVPTKLSQKSPHEAHMIIAPFRASSIPAYCAIIRPDEIPGRPEYKGETDEVRKRIKKPNAWI